MLLSKSTPVSVRVSTILHVVLVYTPVIITNHNKVPTGANVYTLSAEKSYNKLLINLIRTFISSGNKFINFYTQTDVAIIIDKVTMF